MHAAGPRAHHQGSLRSRAAPQSRTSARRSPRVLEALQRPAHARHCQAPRRQAAERTQAALLGRRGVARRHTAAAPSPQRAGMPVSAQHTWEEEDGSLVVHVRVAGVPRSKIDVFASDCYIKVNAPPYFFQVDLRGEIDEEQSAATIEPSGIVFRAVKRSRGLWGKLETDLPREEAEARRSRSIEEAHHRANVAKQRARDARKQYAKEMSTRTFDIASRKRQEVERLKAEQLQQERDGIARWQAGLQEGAGGESDYESDEEDERRREAAGGAAAMPDHPDYYGRGHRHNKENEGDDNARKIEERVAAAEKFAEQELAREEEEERAARDAPARARARDDPGEAAALPEAPVPVRVLPPPRVREPVKLSFTPTEAPHLPMREKREKEIKEYRRKQAARGAIEDAVDVTERQPMFLKDKGDALLGRGNLQGALSAYNRALEIEPDLVPVLSNRSLCLLKMGLWGACVEDCGRALELTRRNWEDVDEGRCADANEAARVGRARSKLLCRRAHALASLQRVGEAIEDLEAARKILPSAEVDASLAELQASLAPLTPAEARARGDERLRLRDAEGAHAAYSTIVGLPKGDVGDLERAAALSGRAAACILMERFGEAVGDAGTGLALLVRGATGAEDVDVAPCASEDEMVERLACLKAGGGAAEGQDGGLVQWQVQDKLVARRAMALAHVRRYAEARADFAALAALREGRGDVAGAEAARADAGKVAEMLRQEDA